MQLLAKCLPLVCALEVSVKRYQINILMTRRFGLFAFDFSSATTLYKSRGHNLIVKNKKNSNPSDRKTPSSPVKECSASNTLVIANEHANIQTTNWTNMTATSSTMRTRAMWVMPVPLLASKRLPNTRTVKMVALRPYKYCAITICRFPGTDV